MKTKLTLLFVLTISLLVNAQVPSFATKKSLGDNMCARHSAGMTTLNNKLYIFGGYPMPGVGDFTEYNPITGQINKLIDIPNLGLDSNSRCLFTVQNNIYSLVDASVHKYSFTTSSWTTISMRLGPGITGNPDAGFVIGDIIYFTSATGNNFYSFNTVTNVTTQLANYPSFINRSGAFAFEINGKGYFGGGNVGSVSCQTTECSTRSDFYEYDPTTNTWAAKASLPNGLEYGVGISHNGRGYAGLGIIDRVFPASPYNAGWYKYDPTTDTWALKQNFMNASAVNSELSMFRSCISKIGNDFYFFGGQRGVAYLDEVYKYSTTTNTWSVVTYELGQNREAAMGFYSNGKIYIGGGIDNESLNDFWEYDTATDNWNQKANFPISYGKRSCSEINGKGYFVGGVSGYLTPTQTLSNHTNELLEYNPATNVFSYKSPYPDGNTYGMTSFAYNANLYAGMGQKESGGVSNKFYKYNPTTDSWTTLANVPFSSVNCSSFILGNIGYVISNNPNASAGGITGKYNFDTDVWTTETHNLRVGGQVNQAFVQNSTAYISVDSGNTSSNVLYQYNSSNGTWKQITNLSFKNINQTIIPSPDGVYFCFGGGQIYHPLKLPNTTDLRILKFDTAVSNKFGVYQAEINGGYINPLQCGTGYLPANATHSIFDTNGDLFSTVTAGASGISGGCYTVTSLDLATPFKTATRNFGNGIVETGMILNKSVNFNSNNSLSGNGTFRLYFTTAELNKLVGDFNVRYNSNRTTADIKLVRYYDNSAVHDANPLNNTSGSHTIFATTTGNYGSDKFYDINLASTVIPAGELYAVLLAGQDLSTITFIQPTTINLCKGAIATPLSITTSANVVLKWYTVSTGGRALIAAPTPTTTTVGTKLYYVSQVIGGVEGSRVTITVNTIALPTTPGTITGITTQGAIVGTTTAATYIIADVVGAVSYLWTAPTGVNIVSGQGTNTVIVNFAGVSAGAGAIGNLSVKAVNSNGCTGAVRNLALTKALPVAPSGIKMYDDAFPTFSTIGAQVAIRSFAKYMGTSTVLRLTATPSLTATSYIWELPEGVNQLSGGTSNEITVNFLGVTNANTFNYTTTSGVSTNVLRIGVKASNGVGASITNTAALLNPSTSSTARQLTLTAVRPAAVAAVTGQIAGLCGASTYTYTIRDTALASSYTVTAPAGAVVNFTSTLTFTVTYPVGFVVNTSTTLANKTLVITSVNGVGTSATARTLTLSTTMPALGVATPTTYTRAIPVSITIAPLAAAVSYNWTGLPAGASIIDGQGTNAVLINFAGVAIGTTFIKLTVTATNACGISTAVKAVNLSNAAPGTKVRQIVAVTATEVYPNPTADSFSIDVLASRTGVLEMTIYSLNGAIVANPRTLKLQQGNNTISADISSLARGVYLVHLTNSSSNEVIIKKLFKE